jgi:hypothetical protein
MLSDLLTQMQRGEVMNGWDLVLSVPLEPVNRRLALAYDRQTPDGWQVVGASYCQVVPDPSGDGDLALYTVLQARLTNPRLTFVAGRNVVDIAFAADGLLRQAAARVAAGFDPAAAEASDPSLRWSLRPLTSETFVASVPLAVVHATTTSDRALSAVVDFPSGSFRFPNLPDAPRESRLSSELRAYFAGNDVRYELFRAPAGQPAALTPRTFRIATVQTNGGESVLQLFFATTSAAPTTIAVNVNEPVPDAGHYSLMISRGLFMEQLAASPSSWMIMRLLERHQLTLWLMAALMAPLLTFFEGLVGAEPTDMFVPYDVLVIGPASLAGGAR